MIFFCSASGGALAQSAAPPLDYYLTTTIGLSADQIADAANGDIVVKLLHTDTDRDVTVFGMIGVHATRDAYASYLRDVHSLISARTRQFGIIGDPVAAADLRSISVDKSEWRDLRSCSVNDCDFKLSVALMQQFTHSVNWDGPNAETQVDSLMRGTIGDLVAAYRTRGDSAMLRYDDTHSTLGSDAFTALLRQSSYLSEYAPALHDYLRNYPAARPDSTADVIYWSQNRIPHLRPTLTLDQMVVYTPSAGSPLVARKQIYADHYFEARLELSSVFDAPSLRGGPGLYLVSVHRYRFDSLPRGFLNIRGRVRSQLQNVMRSDLERERSAIEGRVAG